MAQALHWQCLRRTPRRARVLPNERLPQWSRHTMPDARHSRLPLPSADAFRRHRTDDRGITA